MNSTAPTNTRVRLDQFSASVGLDRGRPAWFEALWYVVKCLVFLSPLPFPQGLKRRLLRAFGAQVGEGVVIKPRVNIHLPWKFSIGDHSWLGEEVFILNLEPVQIGSNACVSQRAFLCTGNHDYRRPDFAYRNAPITVGDGAWVGAQVFVVPGATIGQEAVVTAGSIVVGDIPARMVCSGNPCRPVKPRYAEEAMPFPAVAEEPPRKAA